MAQTYKFQITMPVTDTLPRNRISNTVHLEHTTGGVVSTDLEGMCQDIAEMYQARYLNAANEIQVKCYDVDAVPNYPRASVVVNSGVAWPTSFVREVTLVLSFAGANRGNRRQRGRIYLQPNLTSTGLGQAGVRPTQSALDWALKFYTEPNGSFPDLGGVDWKFGVWSHSDQAFHQSQQAWVNDDWDIQRRRGLRESTRVTATREG